MANMEKVLAGGIAVLVLIVVLINLGASLIPEVQSAGDDLNESLEGENLGPMFSSDGIVPLIIVVGLLIAVIVAGVSWAKVRK
jgi:hypothetical protein